MVDAAASPVAALQASLRARLMRAAGWLVAGNLSSQLLRLLSNLALTRLLAPDAFALVAAINALYFALVMFSDLGLWQSVVKSDRGAEPAFLGTAWSVQLLRGGLLAVMVLALALALWLANRQGFFDADTVYADARLAPMLAALSLCALLQGLESMKLALAQRRLELRHLARLELASQLLATAVTLGLTYCTGSVWSLLAGTLGHAATRTLLSHGLLSGQGARPCWDADCARELLCFGKWIFLSSIIGFLAAHGEKLLLGGYLSSGRFGQFAIAAMLMAAAVGLYSSVNAHIVFSSLSQAIRGGDRHGRRAYLRMQQLADLMLGLLAGAVFMLGDWPVQLLYDQRYQDAGWMFQWLGLGLLGMRQQVVEQLMFARGQSAWVTVSNTMRALGLAVLVPAGFHLWGEPGAVAAVVLSQFSGWPVALWYKARNGLLAWSSEACWLPALLAGLVVGGLGRAAIAQTGTWPLRSFLPSILAS